MTIIVDGVDLLQHTAQDGVKYKRVDIDGGQGGTSILGTQIVDIYASKIEYELNYEPLTESQLRQVLSAVATETFTAIVTDPLYGSDVTITMMVTQPPQAVLSKREQNGTLTYTGVSLTIREV